MHHHAGVIEAGIVDHAAAYIAGRFTDVSAYLMNQTMNVGDMTHKQN